MDKSDEVQNILNNPKGLTGETQKLRLNFDTNIVSKTILTGATLLLADQLYTDRMKLMFLCKASEH
jgi:hypothetical protein